MDIASTITNWYNINKRELPWRKTNDAYCIWVSEIIMQQTRIEQGLPYYNRFLNQFPTVFDLAKASEDEVMLIWQGLGYYSRARNMHFTAKQIANELNGVFPNTSEGLLKLKGIGKYTAAAISSIAFGENIAAIDGNVIRVISRLFNIKTPINDSNTLKEIEQISNRLVKNTNAANFNQALMDLGASICCPKNPDCNNCPLLNICDAKAYKTQLTIPVKNKNTKVRNRFFAYFIFKTDNSILIKKRSENDIWKGLYDFDLIEFTNKPSLKTIFKHPDAELFIRLQKGTLVKTIEAKAHKLSHQTIFTLFFVFHSNLIKPSQNQHAIPINTIPDYAFPKLIDIYLEQLLN